MEGKKAIVFGATGIVGGNLITRLLSSDKAKWTVVAVSTSEPNFWTWWGDKRVQWINANLLDEQECKLKFQQNQSLHSAEYVFFEAYKQSDDNNRMLEENMAMFKNALCVLDVAKNVKRVHLNTGSKYYGAFDGTYKTPAEECDERRQSPFFYYNQEDYLSELQQGKSWKYLVTRPPELGGYSKGYMNLAQTIAVYATFCHEQNLKFKCPGNTNSWERVMDIADVGLLVELIEEGVLSDNPKYHNQAFNCNNGDVIRWKYLWPRIAEYFGLEYEPATDKCFSLHERLSDRKEDWKRIAHKYNLKIDDLSKAATFDFADKCIGRQWDSFLSMNKAREAGFKEYKATDRMYTEIFDYLRKLNVIPTW